MASKFLLFVSLVVFGLVVPLAESQSQILGRASIQGILFCSINGTIGVNGTATPAFQNATVGLRCGQGPITASTTTNSTGSFSLLVNLTLSPVQLVQTLLNNCSVVVTTPLATCNASLPVNGNLTSILQFVGTTLGGLLPIFNFIPIRFRLDV